MEAKLKPREVADLVRCDPSTIRRWIADGQLPAEQRLNERRRPEYLIPLSALPPEAQQRYFDRHCIELAPIAAPAKRVPKPKAQPIDQYSAAEREQISFWTQLVEDWQRARDKAGKKAECDDKFVIWAQLEYPDIQISVETLYRRWAALREGNLEGLVDRRGKARKGMTALTAEVETAFLTFYLDESQHPIKRCLALTEEWARQHTPEALPLPGYSTFYRKAGTIPYAVKVLCREGKKAYYDKCSPYIRREYESINANDFWVGDTHTMDVISLGPNGKTHRLYLSAWLDARSGIFTGWYVSDQPSSQSSLNALRRGIESYGIPNNVYVDNGREFLTYDIGGRGHRAKKRLADGSIPFAPPGVFERLGIKMTNAIVRNARAKLVERRFEDVKNYVSRLFCTYTGGNVVEKPDRLKHVLKAGKIPTDAEVIAAIDTLITGYLNCEPYGGSVEEDRGMRRIDVHRARCPVVRKADKEDLRLMLMRTSKPVTVDRDGVRIPIKGIKIDFYDPDFVRQLQGKQVYVRFDPDDLSSVRAYDMDDRFLCELPQSELTAGYLATQDQIAELQAAKRRAERATAEFAAALKLPDDPQRALELMTTLAARNIADLPVGVSAKSIKLVRDAEEPLLRAVGDLDMSLMTNNIIKRRGGMEDDDDDYL